MPTAGDEPSLTVLWWCWFQIKAVQDIIDKCVSNNASIYWSKDEVRCSSAMLVQATSLYCYRQVMTEIVSTLEGSKFKAEVDAPMLTGE